MNKKSWFKQLPDKKLSLSWNVDKQINKESYPSNLSFNNGISLLPFDIDNDGIICYEIKKIFNFRKNIIFNPIRKRIIKWDEKIKNKLKVPYLQYKIGRCGSRLLSNMLATDPIWKIVSEPVILNSILNKINNNKNVIKKPIDIILKKIIDILSIKENDNQRFCYIDLTSQNIFHYNLLKKTFPNKIHFFIWRHPKEVATSLRRNPPGWWESYDHIGQYIDKIIKNIPDDMIVFYYGHILYFLLPYWLYKCLKLNLSNEIVNSMRSVMKRNAKYPYKTFKNDINNSNLYDDISYLYSYNKKIIDFEINHPPYQFIYNSAKDMLNYDFEKNKKEILNNIKEAKIPFIINNYKEASHVKPFKIKKYIENINDLGLKAKRENYFVYSRPRVLSKDINIEGWNEEIESTWEKINFNDWEKDPSLYMISDIIIDKNNNDDLKYFSFPFINKLPIENFNPRIRISHKGAVTCAHFDPLDSLILNLHGTKKILLFPPNLTEKLLVYPDNIRLARRVVSNISYFDPTRFDIDFSKVYRVILQPGQILFFPKFWAHLFVTQEEGTISLNWRIKNDEYYYPYQIPSKELVKFITSEQYPYYHKGLI